MLRTVWQENYFIKRKTTVHKLSIPLNGIDIETIYSDCISSFRNEKKTLLFGYTGLIKKQANEYKDSVEHILENCPKVSLSSDDEKALKSVYIEKMAKRDCEKPYSYYSSILSHAHKNKCPICELIAPSTLDHYLPQKIYPLLSVVPANLVPECSLCNGAKSTYVGSCLEEMLPHPYFDDLSNVEWLKVRLIFDEGILPIYSNGYAGTNPTLDKRISLMIKTYKLDERYEDMAGDIIAGSIGDWKETLSLTGKEHLKEHIEGQKRSAERQSINNWKVAMYKAVIVQFEEVVDYLTNQS